MGLQRAGGLTGSYYDAAQFAGRVRELAGEHGVASADHDARRFLAAAVARR
jgi:hypothetical protein